MNEELKILVAAELKKNTTQTLNTQIAALKLNSLKLDVSISGSTATIKSEIQKATQQANQYIKSSVVTPIYIPFQFDTNNSAKMKAEMTKIMNSISNNKGNLVDYKINTNMVLNDDKTGRIENLTGATLQYKNALNELVTAEIKYQKIGETTNPDGTIEDIMGWSTATQQYHQNIEKTIALQQKQAEEDSKVARGKIELAKQMENMNAKANKAGIQLSPENQAQFNSKLNSAKTIKDLQEVGHYIKMADLEWKGLNATMTKDLPNTALENVNKKLLTMSPTLDTLQSKFQTLGSSMPKDTSSKFDRLRNDLAAINAQDDPSEKISQYNELIASVQKLNAELRSLKQEQTANKFNISLGLDKIKLDNRLTSWLKENQKAAKLCGTEIERIRSLIQGADKMQLGQLQKEFQNVQAQAKAAGLTGRTLFGEIGNNAKKFFDWFMVGGGVTSAVRAVKEIYTNVVELDGSLVELQKVSDLTGNSLSAFASKAFDAGQKIGRTGKEVIDATTVFKRAGYNINESFKLAESALVMTNVGDGIKNVEDASSALISVLKGFKMSDSDAMSIVDRINQVSNTAAIDFQNITEGLRRVSGTLSQTGASVDQTIGLLTGGFGQLRDIEMVSSGLIMISQRLRGIGEDGEAIEGLAPKVAKEFKEIANIDIEDENGQLRNTFDILSDMARVFPTLTTKQQQYLGELAAGNRQIKVLNSILQGWEDVEKAVGSSVDSQGSAMIENEKFLNSVQGKMNQFSSQFQELSSTVLDSGLIKGSFDAGTGILKFFTDLISTMGAVPALAATVAGALSFKNVGISQEYALPLPMGAVA